MRRGTLRTALRTGALLGVGLLVACGTNPDDRTTGSAAGGAGTGAAIGLIGGPVGVVVGAVIGGGAGALAGATTKPQERQSRPAAVEQVGLTPTAPPPTA